MSMETNSREANAIEGFGSLAQATRLAAVRHLLAVHPESLPAGEIARLCEVPHNTMSTHLGISSRAGLISVEKDGRSMNYRADVDGFRDLLEFLSRDCCNGRPELCGDAFDLPIRSDGEVHDTCVQRPLSVHPQFSPLDHRRGPAREDRPWPIPGLLRRIGPGREPVPEVIDRLKALGHDVSRLHSKSWDEFKGPQAPRMDFVIALCDAPKGQFCPDLDTQFVTGAWPLPDPAQFTGSATERTTF